MTELLNVAQGNFELQRLPLRSNELLRAWDAADEYLLNYLAEVNLPNLGNTTLIINDSFGALATALAPFAPMSLSDSYLAQQATRLNLKANGLNEQTVHLLNSLQAPIVPIDLLLVKAPKTLALLEDLLHRLRPYLHSKSKIVVAGMLKNLPPSVWSIIQRLIGPTQNSLAKKKARLIFAEFNPELAIPANPYPVTYTLERTQYSICNHANVFSREQLDIGTRFFLQHLPRHFSGKAIVDLGCGNGIVGLMAAAGNPDAKLHFVDESFMAVASAEQNFTQAFGNSRSAIFTVGDTLEEFPAKSVDLILCNPPFHQQQTIGDHLAVKMFKQALKTLRPEGELWVIGNRHLGYQSYLAKLFGASRLVASNSKFVIVKAVKSA